MAHAPSPRRRSSPRASGSIGARIAGLVVAVLAMIAMFTAGTLWALTSIVDGASTTIAEAEQKAVPFLRLADDVNRTSRSVSVSALDPADATTSARSTRHTIAEVDAQIARLDANPKVTGERPPFERGVREWRAARDTIPRLLRHEVPPFGPDAIAVQSRLKIASDLFRSAHRIALKQVHDHLEQVRDDRERASVVAVLACITVIALGGLAGLWLRSTLVRPIRALTTGARRLASGDLDQPVEVRGPRELAELATTFNSMQRDLEHRERELVYHALHDPLTGLGNRALFQEHLRQAIARLHRRKHGTLAILLIDLDGFKKVNDTAGHATGDETIREAADRITGCLREDDMLSRLGGDEFVIVAEDVNEGADAIAARICEVMRRPFRITGRRVFVSASIGIAIAETGAESVDELLRDADLAMYQAKHAGGDGYRRFSSSFRERAMERFELESDLRGALERGELERTISRSSTCATARSPASRRWRAGTTRPGAWCTRPSSSPSRRTRGCWRRSRGRCSGWPCATSAAGSTRARRPSSTSQSTSRAASSPTRCSSSG